MNKEVLKKMYSGTEKVSLSEVKVDLAVTDDINSQLKNINNALKSVNDANNKIVKLADQLNAVYKTNAAPYMNFSKQITSQVDGLYKKLESLTKELGVDMKTTPAFTSLMDAYQFLGQIDDAVANIKTSISSIGK